ncbi:MAG: SPOR domain-containing protein [Gemmatimonadales bacterium]
MHPGKSFLVPLLAVPLLAGACASVDKPRTELPATLESALPSAPDQASPAVPPVVTDLLLRRALAGKWRMEPKMRDAIISNIVLELHPDGRLDLSRDDGGGTNFTIQLWGAWAAAASAPDRVEITLGYVGARPGRRCRAFSGRCEDYKVPSPDTVAFTRTGPDAMETPGAVWRRDPQAAAPGSSGPAAPPSEGSSAPAAPPSEGKEPAALAPLAGRFALHLFSVPSPTQVPSEWRHLTERYPELAGLGLREPRAVRDPRRGTMYTVDVGAFATEAEARAVCDGLSSRGRSCKVIVP